jgi:hypothetical protein
VLGSAGSSATRGTAPCPPSSKNSTTGRPTSAR